MAERDASERETRQEGRPRPALDVTVAGAGDRFDSRYVLHRLLASGGGANVYAGEHVFTKRKVAIKVPHAATPLARARMEREMEALGIVRGDGVVEMLDAGEVDGVPYVVFDLLEGRTLAGLLAARGRLDIAAVQKVGVEVAHVLERCHLRGVVHRDVKPSNVFVSPGARNQLTLLDFGIASLADDGLPREKLTQENALLGTPEYMAPEALLATPTLDHRVDVYGLGVTLYECVTGTVPFDGQYAEILQKLANEPPRPVRELRPEVPAGLAKAIEKSLARAAEGRFQTMEEMRAALESTAAHIESVNIYEHHPGKPGAGAARVVTSGQTLADAPRAISRRRHKRAPYVTLARITRSNGEAVDGRVEEVSEGGLQFVGDQPIPRNESVSIRFALPSSGRVTEVKAAARWNRTRRATHATGFEFTEFAEEARGEVRTYVAIMSADVNTPD